MALCLPIDALHGQPSPQRMPPTGPTAVTADITFAAGLPACPAANVITINTMPVGSGGTARMTVCRRDYTESADEVLRRYRRDLEGRGYKVNMQAVDAASAQLTAQSGDVSIEVFGRRGDAQRPYVEIIHELQR